MNANIFKYTPSRDKLINNIKDILLLICIISIVAYIVYFRKSVDEHYSFETDLNIQGNITGNNVVLNNTSFDTIYTKIFNNMYPIGSVYVTFDASFDPNNNMKGKWVKLDNNKFLRTSGNGKTNETGGADSHIHKTKDHTLTIDEIPSHKHKLKGYGATLGKGETGWRWGGKGTKEEDNVMTSTGGDKAHNHGDTESANNLPSYVTVIMWKRIN